MLLGDEQKKINGPELIANPYILRSERAKGTPRNSGPRVLPVEPSAAEIQPSNNNEELSLRSSLFMCGYYKRTSFQSTMFPVLGIISSLLLSTGR